MKKIISITMAIMMIMAMATNVFAATVGENGSQDIPVTGIYNTSTTTPNVYSVDINWDGMTFTYNEAGTKTWNAADHSYSTTTEGSWDKTSANITVTNHSNVEVEVSTVYTAIDTAVTGTLTNATGTLAAGVENAYDDAASMTVTLTISGKPTTVSAEGVAIGTITVTIK